MIHGNRQARAATQSRALLVAGALLLLLVAALLAGGAASVSFQTPWKAIAVAVIAAVAVGWQRARHR